MQVQESSFFFHSPSFNCYTSQNLAEVVAKITGESEDTIADNSLEGEVTDKSEDTVADNLREDLPLKDQPHQEAKEGNNDDDDDFEFTFSCVDRSPISADDIFSNGQIRPIYPIFNRDLLFRDGEDGDFEDAASSTIRIPLRKLLIEERDSLPSSSSLEIAEAYSVWRPKTTEASPVRCQKSNSTGSSKRWRFRDLLHRSNSDGKDTYVLLAPSSTCSNSKNKKKDDKAAKGKKTEIPKEKRNSGEVKVAGKGKGKKKSGEKMSPHEMYVRNRATKEAADRRRSFLPYRQDIVGFFTNVNGLSKTLHPF